MWGLAEVCRVAAATLAVLLAAVLLRDQPRDRSARVSALLMVTVVAHLLFPLVTGAGVWPPAVHVVMLVNLAVPLAFWLLAQVHFDDDFRWRPVHGAVGIAVLGVGYFSCLGTEPRLGGGWLPRPHDDLWSVAQKLLSIGVVVHALLRIYVGAGSDLLVRRLRLRYGVLMASGTYMLLELLAELVLRTGPSAAADRAHAVIVLLILLGTSFLALRTSPEILKPARMSLDVPVGDPVLLERLKRLMEVDAIYREEGLTIRALADRLGTAEHKLRSLINSQLGFKNFNAFLHHHRIREAQQALADPARAHLGVAEVAYAVGYRSLATFNKAFKDLTSLTPTEFRATRPPASSGLSPAPGFQN